MSLRSQIWNLRTIVTRNKVLAPLGESALNAISWLHRINPLQLSKESVRHATYLNAGCGKKPREGFVNLDYNWQPGIELIWDLGRTLPFQENSLRGIYTEHCMEHLPFGMVTSHVLPEFYRVLAPGGCLRLIVPDGGLYLNLYAEAQQNPEVSFPFEDAACVTPMMHVNKCFRNFGHLFAYDFATLEHFMRKAGFSTVTRRSFMNGSDPRLLLDSPERAPESLYVEAIK